MPVTIASPHAVIAALLRDRLLTGVAPTWRELTNEYDDERNYLSLSLTCEQGSFSPVALIEFGVQDATDRHAVGILQAAWRRAERQFGALEVLTIDGEPVTLPAFMDRLQGYLALEQTNEEATHAA